MPTATRIDGKAKAADLAAAITAETATLWRDHGVKPGLAVVIIGEDPASQVYVRNKKRTAESCGFHSVQHALPAQASEAEVLALIDTLNADDTVHGILVQLPLPEHLDVAQTRKQVHQAHAHPFRKVRRGSHRDQFVRVKRRARNQLSAG